MLQLHARGVDAHQLVLDDFARLSTDARRRWDGVVGVSAGDGKRRVMLALHILSTAYPRDVRQAIDQFRHAQVDLRQLSNVPVYPVLLSENLSPGAKSTLREAGIGYFEVSGTMYLDFGFRLIDIERTAKRKPRRAADLFSESRETVIHAVLHRWWAALAGDSQVPEWFSNIEIANDSMASPYTVSQTLKELELMEIVCSEGGGPTKKRRLERPGQLLDLWGQAWNDSVSTRLPCYWFASTDLVGKLAAALRDESGWLFTGAAMANQLMHTLTEVNRVEVVVPRGEASRYAQGLRAETAEIGANVVFVERQAAAFLFPEKTAGGLPQASPFIQYLDLLNGYGRNDLLAGDFRRKVLRLEAQQ
ncbi:hypothetical protein [Achromobacter sp. DH1f]|uniref:hypothetical protein n=1 Tax=Achromobacter sp. DH1f TaxID=1397275 RepID=UPI0012FF4CBA|nr:hypothetical protein [Achromobacter sp. DH1f]